MKRKRLLLALLVLALAASLTSGTLAVYDISQNQACAAGKGIASAQGLILPRDGPRRDVRNFPSGGSL